ncbi:DUF3037 domain-containing protein [Kangiella profundi]|uniref:DUF3037 domain-containing protein n=1 Tax=Kangiella profundi TaxID=1561924 RepID=A0A2K9AGE6_9GAMM|nr:DUF3037 domain-containing protein [Kangiella profundi]AUD78024.1 DUF3037 domain-containing protein [Kangiella profundi]GGE90531.1 hypothetical protein GCM10011356_00870 [Kangiella profundi]
MRYACKYAVIKFQPYAETEEFANVGIVVFCPKNNYFDFKIAPKKFSRVTNFFEDLEGKVFKYTLDMLETELLHIQNFFYSLGQKRNEQFFDEVTRLRESVVRYGNIKIVGTDNPKLLLNKLYDRYVGRNFLTKEYREQIMVKTIKQEFKSKNIGINYTEKLLTTQLRNVRLPLVAELEEKHFKAIKPLAFTEKKTTQIIEHGELWFNKIKWLLKEDVLKPDDILLPIEGPQEKGLTKKAFNEIVQELKQLEINIVNYSDTTAIINFATNKQRPAPYIVH